MEHMSHFIRGLITQTKMHLGASTMGTLRAKTYDEVKTLIKIMFQNEYRSSDRAVKQKGILAIDLNTTLLAPNRNTF